MVIFCCLLFLDMLHCALRIFKGADYVTLNHDQLRAMYGDRFFTSFDPQTRQEVNLQAQLEADLVAGIQTPLYAENGRRIARKRGSPRGRPCGVLLNLRTLPSFFREQSHANLDDVDVEEYDDPLRRERSGPHLQLFPQAFLADKGHFQATRLPQPFYHHLRSISQDVIRDTNDDEEDISLPLPIMGASSQGYNAIVHRMRGTVSAHDIQRADVTAHAGSVFASLPEDQKVGDVLTATLKNSNMPHDRLEKKLSSDMVNTDLRMENVYHFDLSLVRDDRRTAS